MTWLMIGSVAAHHYFSDWRQPKDIDLLTPAKISGNHGDVCVVDAQWHELAEELIDLSANKVFADPWLLHTLKLSHAYWNIHWDKTMLDIHGFQRRGVPFDQPLHDRLVKMWEKVHGAKKVNLNQSKETFWKDGVKRRYDHEWVHTLVAFYDTPLHELLHVPNKPVWISKEKFFELETSLQLDAALEEILTFAIERGGLGVQSTKAQRLAAVHRAHFTLCTSATKGWFAQFLVQHAYELKITLRPRWYPQLDRALSLLPRNNDAEEAS